MCRNIKILFNFDPPVTEQEIRNASLQFVRKISGFSKPSKANEVAFQGAVDEIAGISSRLLHSLQTNSSPRNREEEAAKAKARSTERFATAGRGWTFSTSHRLAQATLYLFISCRHATRCLWNANFSESAFGDGSNIR